MHENSAIVLIINLCLLAFQSFSQNRPLTVISFTSSATTIELCPFESPERLVNRVTLRVNVSNPDNDVLKYTYVVPVGKIEGSGSSVVWDLKGEPDGSYKAAVLVEDSKGNKARAILTLIAKIAPVCDGPAPPCPKVTIEFPREIESGRLVEFLVNVIGGESATTPSYTWTSDAGRIVRGKYENKMTLDLLGFPFEQVTGTVDVRGYDPSCPGTVVSCTTKVKE